MDRHALITGGAGFIGSHLAEYLLGEGWAVTAVDDLSTGAIDNVRHLEERPEFRIRVASAADRELLTALAADATHVFHLAAVVGVRKVIEDPAGTIEKNQHTTETVLQTCSLYRLPLLLTSTSEVYGSNPKERFHEDDDSIIGNSRHRRWSYAASKLLDEFYAFAHYHASSLPVTIARLFNTIGPRQVGHYGMVVPTFVGQALRGEPITVFGDGTQRRCFTDVRDTVRCLAALIETPGAAGRVYNVGADREISIRDLADTIRTMTGSDSPVTTLGYREAYGEDFVDMERRVPDTTRLRQTVGFAPETPLEDALQSVVDDMRARLAAEDSGSSREKNPGCHL